MDVARAGAEEECNCVCDLLSLAKAMGRHELVVKGGLEVGRQHRGINWRADKRQNWVREYGSGLLTDSRRNAVDPDTILGVSYRETLGQAREGVLRRKRLARLSPPWAQTYLGSCVGHNRGVSVHGRPATNVNDRTSSTAARDVAPPRVGLLRESGRPGVGFVL